MSFVTSGYSITSQCFHILVILMSDFSLTIYQILNTSHSGQICAFLENKELTNVRPLWFGNLYFDIY